MCGKALPFRKFTLRTLRLRLPRVLLRHSLKTEIRSISERQSLSAHQAAKPQREVETEPQRWNVKRLWKQRNDNSDRTARFVLSRSLHRRASSYRVRRCAD